MSTPSDKTSKELARQLKTVRMERFLSGLLRGGLTWLSISLAIWAVLILLDVSLTLPAELRLPMGLLGVGVTGWLFYRHVVSSMRSFYSLERAAYELEQEYDIPRNMLINAYQLRHQDLTEDESKLAEQTFQKAKVWGQRLREADTWEFGTLLKVGCFAILILCVWAGGLAFAPQTVGNSLMRYSFPHADVPPAGRVDLRVEPARNVTLQRGEDHRVLVFVNTRNHQGKERENLLEHRPRIVVKESSDVPASRAEAGDGVRMLSVPDHKVSELMADIRGTEAAKKETTDSGAQLNRAVYKYEFQNLRRPRSFRIFHGPGRTHTRSYRINLRSIPELTQSRFRVEPPGYTGNEISEQSGPPDSLDCLPGSRVGIEIELDTPVDELIWRGPGNEISFSQTEDQLWRAVTNIKEAGSYEVVSRRTERKADGKQGKVVSQIVASGNVLTRRDDPPHVQFNTNRMNKEIWPGQSLKLEINAKDDFGVSKMALTVEQAGGEESETRELMSWDLNGPPGKSDPESVRHTVQLEPSKFSPGQKYVFRARAADFHPDGQTARSDPLLVKIKKMDDLSDVNETSGALDLLSKAVKQQRRALSNTRTVSNYMNAVIGEDPEHPEFTFDNHRVRMEARQTRVNRLLNKVSNKTPKEMQKYAEDVVKVRDELVKPLAKEIRGYAGNSTLWFDDSTRVVSGNQYQDEGEGWHRVQPSTHKARYAGLRMTSHNGQFSISDFEFLDEEGVPIPPPYVNRFRVAPGYKKWDGPVGFVELKENELKKITSKALKSDLSGGGGPVVSLKGIVEDAPDEGVTLYAVRVIKTAEPRRVLLYAGSSDSLRIWLNGADQLQLKKLARRKPRPDSYRTELQLQKGKNVIVAEVSADKRSPALAMRFADPDGTKLSLTETGRLVPAPNKRIIHAGGSPEHARKVIDGDGGSAWKVKRKDPVMLIVDAGHRRKLGGVRFKVPGKTSNKKLGVGKYDLFLAPKLRIQKKLPPRIKSIEQRQSKAVDRLVEIRTAWLEHQQQKEKNLSKEKEQSEPKGDKDRGPALASGKEFQDLVGELLKENERSQKLSEKRKSVLENTGEDLSDEAREKLQDIKNKEKQSARRMRDIVQDMSQIGNQNLSNSMQRKNKQTLKKSDKLAETNEEIAKEDITQITDNLDTASQELAEELEKQSRLEFGDSSRTQDMHETSEDRQTPLPEAELPQTLNDLVGEMKEDFQEFKESQQTVGSQLKSLDPAGPISPGRQSSYTAQGKTGNEPPDGARELEGRSGFGRTGRASGQGAANVAKDIPQDDMAPPDRKTGTSLEKGGVKDKSTEARAGGTGLGKETNRTGQFGLEGELPDTLLDRMRKTAQKTQKLRENMSGLATQLKRHNLSTKQLEEATKALKQVEIAAEEGNYAQFRRSYQKAMKSVAESEETVGQKVGKRLIRKREKGDNARPQNTRKSTVPDGYTEMVSKYFQAIAEEEKKNE